MVQCTPLTGTLSSTILDVNGIVQDVATTTAVVASTITTIDTFPAASFRSVKYLIQITQATVVQYEVLEMLLIHDGTTVFATTYGNVSTGTSSIGSFDAVITTGNVVLSYNPGANAKTVKVIRTAVTV